jgi:hypothetical protein
MSRSQHDAYFSYRYRAEKNGKPVLSMEEWYRHKKNGTYNSKFLTRIPFQNVFKEGYKALVEKRKSILEDLSKNNSASNRIRLARINQAIGIYKEEKK